MATLRSLAPTTPIKRQEFLCAEILPQGELVLLDGAPGVGKSLISAALTAYISTHHYDRRPDYLLLLASPDQRELLIEFLARHEPDHAHIKGIDFDPAAHTSDGQSLVQPLLSCIETSLKEHKPRLILVDSLEELLQMGSVPTTQELASMWSTLRTLAHTHHCTLLIPRKAGLHESRSYGPFTRLGSETTRYALTLHYHPTDSSIRILTTAKNQRGPIGEQTHARIRLDGTVFLAYTDHHEHVRPAKSPQTWQPAPDHQHETNQIINLVEELMEDKPLPTIEVQNYITRHRFSERAFRRAMRKAKLKIIRIGNDYFYAPTDNMLLRFIHKQQQQKKQEVKKPSEIQARTPGAEACTLRQTG